MRDALIAPLVLKAPHCLLEHDWKDRLSREVILPALNLPLLPSTELIFGDATDTSSYKVCGSCS